MLAHCSWRANTIHFNLRTNRGHSACRVLGSGLDLAERRRLPGHVKFCVVTIIDFMRPLGPEYIVHFTSHNLEIIPLSVALQRRIVHVAWTLAGYVVLNVARFVWGKDLCVWYVCVLNKHTPILYFALSLEYLFGKGCASRSSGVPFAQAHKSTHISQLSLSLTTSSHTSHIIQPATTTRDTAYYANLLTVIVVPNGRESAVGNLYRWSRCAQSRGRGSYQPEFCFFFFFLFSQPAVGAFLFVCVFFWRIYKFVLSDLSEFNLNDLGARKINIITFNPRRFCS